MPYSKTRVDRAGRELAQLLAATLSRDESRIAEFESNALVEAIEVMDWWRHDPSRAWRQTCVTTRAVMAIRGSGSA